MWQKSYNPAKERGVLIPWILGKPARPVKPAVPDVWVECRDDSGSSRLSRPRPGGSRGGGRARRPGRLEWYKRALAVNPDFGDAHDDMACIHALHVERTLVKARP